MKTSVKAEKNTDNNTLHVLICNCPKSCWNILQNSNLLQNNY